MKKLNYLMTVLLLSLTFSSSWASELEEHIQLAKVITKTNTIEIMTQAKTNVNIYNIAGIKIASSLIQSSTTFEVERGIYLVKLNNKVHKVMVP